MKVLVLLLSIFLLSGCATPAYYQYLTAKEGRAIELKKVEQDKEYKDKQLITELKKIDIDKGHKDKQLENDKYLKEKELNNTLEIKKYEIEQNRLLREKEMQMEKEKYEF